MSHDESLHSLYSYYLYANGNYDHNPMMHGPLLFHMNAFIYFLFGDSDFTARLAPALFGIGVIWMTYLLRTYIGRTGAIMAGILVTLSPSLLFHSRYIRDDIYQAFFILVWIYGAFRYLDLRRPRYLFVMVAGMAFGFVTMENHFIHGAIIGAFFAGLAIWQVAGVWLFGIAAPMAFAGSAWYFFHNQGNDRYGMIAVAIGGAIALGLLVVALRGRWHALRQNTAGDLAVLMLTLVLPFTAAFLHVFAGGDAKVFTAAGEYTNQEMIIRLSIMVTLCVLTSLAIGVGWFWGRVQGEDGWRPQLRHWALLMFFFWFVQVLFFTTFFTNTVQGLATGIVGSLGYWLAQQGVKRGNQPVYYYVLIGWLYEFLPAILSLSGMTVIVYNIARSLVGKAPLAWDPAPEANLPKPRSSEEAQLRLTQPGFLRNNRVIFVVFAVWWTIASWIGYSVAGERMPWLFVHMALPMCVLGGWWFGYMVRRIDWRSAWIERTWGLVFIVPAALVLLVVIYTLVSGNAGIESREAGRLLQWLLVFATGGAIVFLGVFWTVRRGFLQGTRLLMVGLVAMLFLLTVRTSLTLNFLNFDMATEYLVYAHASPDVKRALSEIDIISQRTVGDRNVVVAYDDQSSWPMSWYMRQYPNAKFYGQNPTPEAMSAPVVIVGPENRAKVEPYMGRDYVKRSYRLIWWPEMDYFDVTPERLWSALMDPAQRERILQIIAFRKYRDPNDLSKWRDTAHWPYQHEFDMYVRRDLAPQIWDLNVAPVLTEAPNVPVIAPDQHRDVAATQVYGDIYGGSPLLSPRAVALGPNGERVIADTGNHRVVVLDRDGNYLRSFGSYCNLGDPTNTPCVDPDGDGPLVTGDGQFYEPWGVAVDAQGNLFVADTWNGRIQVFDSQGEFLRKWGLFAIADGGVGDPNALFGPRGIAFDLDGNLVVADTGNKRIIRYKPTGEMIDQVGGGGVTPGRFDEPTDVAVDPTDGTILVADSFNQRIQRFSANLEYMGEWQVPGWTGRDIYQKPYLAVTTDGSVYVSDPATAQVVIFDRNGQVQAAFGSEGTATNQFGLPNGMAADLVAGAVVVVDGGNNRVMVFPEVK